MAAFGMTQTPSGTRLGGVDSCPLIVLTCGLLGYGLNESRPPARSWKHRGDWSDSGPTAGKWLDDDDRELRPTHYAELSKP